MMNPYEFDKVKDKKPIFDLKQDELSNNFSKILINGKSKKREIEWKTFDISKRLKKDSREIKKEMIDNERKFKKLKIN